MHKARNLLHTSQPPNDSMLATCSDNHTECCTTDPWMTEAMSLLVVSETPFHEVHHCLLLSCS